MINELEKIISHFKETNKIAKEIAEKYNCSADKDGRVFYVKTKKDLDNIASLINEKVVDNEEGIPFPLASSYSVKYNNEIEFFFFELLPVDEEKFAELKKEIKKKFAEWGLV